MTSHLNYFLLVAMAIAFVNGTMEIRPEFTHRVEARRNQVIVDGYYNMPWERVNAGMERLSYLLDLNTKNEELLKDMQKYFVNHFGDLDWHFVLHHTASGSVPEQYVYYSFDRNSTHLFIAGLKFC